MDMVENILMRKIMIQLFFQSPMELSEIKWEVDVEGKGQNKFKVCSLVGQF